MAPLFLLFPSPPAPLLIFWWLYWVHQLQLVSPSPSCSIVLVLKQGLCIYVFFRFLSILPYGLPEWQNQLLGMFFFFFLLTITMSGRMAEIRRSVSTTKFLRSMCVSFSITDSRFCLYPLFLESNLNFLHSSQWLTLPTLSCLVLYSFWINLLHSLNMWLIHLSLSPHLLFCCFLYIFALTFLVLIGWFCAAAILLLLLFTP